MELDKANRGKKVFEVQHDKGLFEVYEVAVLNGYAYHGYFNDKLSVTSNDPAMVMIGLQRKHVIGLPEGKLIDFKTAVAKLREGR